MQEIEDAVIVNLLTSLVVSLLISIERQIPEHSKRARIIRKVEEAISDLAKLNSAPLSEELVMVGTELFNKTIEGLQYVLENFDEILNDNQLELFLCDRNGVIEYVEYVYEHQNITGVQNA